jgi:hypothetical protein
MSEINYFKIFILYSGDVAADMDHLHIKRIHLMGFSYIFIRDACKSIAISLHARIIILTYKRHNVSLQQNISS